MNDPNFTTPRSLREAGLLDELHDEAAGWLPHFLIGFIAGTAITVTIVVGWLTVGG